MCAVQQLGIYAAYDLPLLLHVRKALDAVLHHLKRARYGHFVIHSFTGSDAQLERIFTLGGHIGIGGTSTYPRAARLQRQLATVPADRYLLETDAPDQPLFGHQGEPNHPVHPALIAANLIHQRGESLNPVSCQSEENRMNTLSLHTDATSQALLTRHLNRAGIPPLHSAPQGHTR